MEFCWECTHGVNGLWIIKLFVKVIRPKFDYCIIHFFFCINYYFSLAFSMKKITIIKNKLSQFFFNLLDLIEIQRNNKNEREISFFPSSMRPEFFERLSSWLFFECAINFYSFLLLFFLFIFFFLIFKC